MMNPSFTNLRMFWPASSKNQKLHISNPDAFNKEKRR
uniref:Uncharacterized protein n=1 Tax=Arundo donax TaxID=35708 RepID=A0A0A9HKZ2_ARUDO